MAEGLREQKKRQTRQALIEAALRLFDAQGYDTATVTEIAAAAGVSPATFFNYFASKEEVVFADQHLFAEVLPGVLTSADPAEPIGGFMLRAVRELAAAGVWNIPLDDPLAAIRVRLIQSVPSLRAAFLLRNAYLVDGWTRAAHESYAGRAGLDEIATLVGAIAGGIANALQVNATADGRPRRSETEVAVGAAELVVRGFAV